MSPRAAGLLVTVLAVLCCAVPAQAARPPATGAPGTKHTWAPADKHAYGTAHQLAGHAYFTLRQASLSEVYYPDLSTPSFRGLQFAITDGTSFVDREVVDDDPRHIEPVAPGVTASVTPLDRSLAYRQVTENARWRLTKTWITDPARDSVLLRLRFEAKTRTALRLFVLADPAPGNDGNDDRGISGESTLVAYDDKSASAVAASPALAQTSSGYRGTASDPWRDLQDYKLERTDATQPGNVVQGARAALDGMDNQTMTLAIGFGRDATAATAAATGSLTGGFDPAKAAYDSGWSAYLSTLKAPPAPVAGDAQMKRLYEQSVLVLAALEDKTHRGASIAAPNMPWIWGTLTLADDKETSDPYHLVWPRDFYHAATAQKAAGDDAAANRLVDYLWEVQKPEGDFWQNTRVDGTPVWKSEQLDETSLPVLLAWWLGRTAPADWDNIRAAADYLMTNEDGPRTGQERWENQDGYSPNTIATEIAALVCAADVARRNGDAGRAAAYEARADEWQAKVESWTATTNGPYSPKPYYLRVTKDGNPDNGFKYTLGDNFPRQVDQREIVDNSFLGLVLFGVKPWNDQTILNSLKVGDETSAEPLKVTTKNGEFWRRFTFDGYGEQADGGDWDLFFDNPARQTFGRAWPLLAGERGEYELIAGQDATARLKAIAGAANDGLMLPEQVWDGRPPDEANGEGTRSATPLAWTHAQFVRLAWSIQAGEPIERPSIVACRYQKQLCG
ncbi:MAG TPA: glycoside hydrolase family 15 protein [Solirubrobacteraceae bacterium]|nr:glycoside hydrolase family 15 protein [Solirubrobacteraceae bacterium]